MTLTAVDEGRIMGSIDIWRNKATCNVCGQSYSIKRGLRECPYCEAIKKAKGEEMKKIKRLEAELNKLTRQFECNHPPEKRQFKIKRPGLFPDFDYRFKEECSWCGKELNGFKTEEKYLQRIIEFHQERLAELKKITKSQKDKG